MTFDNHSSPRPTSNPVTLIEAEFRFSVPNLEGTTLLPCEFREILTLNGVEGSIRRETSGELHSYECQGEPNVTIRFEEIPSTEDLLRARDILASIDRPGPVPICSYAEFIRKAERARPIDGADCGSERQVKAFTEFTEAVHSVMNADERREWHSYALKATENEIIEYGLDFLEKIRADKQEE